jgi:hypothetical protein
VQFVSTSIAALDFSINYGKEKPPRKDLETELSIREKAKFGENGSVLIQGSTNCKCVEVLNLSMTEKTHKLPQNFWHLFRGHC